MKRILGALAIILALALGGGYLWLQQHSSESIRDGLEEFRTTLPTGASLAYAEVETAPLESSATLTDLRLESPGGHVFTAASFTVADVTTDTGGRITSVGRFAAEDAVLALKTETPTRLHAVRFEGAELQADALQRAIDGDLATWPTLARLTFETLRIEQDGTEEYLLARAGEATDITEGRIGQVLLQDFEMLAVEESDDTGKPGETRQEAPDRRLHKAREAEFRDLDIAFFHHLGQAETRPGPDETGRIAATFRGLATSENDTPVGTIETVAIDLEISGDLSVETSLEADGLHVPVTAQVTETGPPNGLQRLGYEELNGRFNSRFSLDSKSGELLFAFDLDIAEAGALAMHLELADVPPFLLREDAEAQGEQALKETMFVRMTIDFADASLVRRMIETTARSQDRTYEALQAEMQANFARLAEAQKDDKSRQSMEVFAAFLREPGQLHIEMEPRQPVPAANVVAILALSPFAAFKLLNAEISRP